MEPEMKHRESDTTFMERWLTLLFSYVFPLRTDAKRIQDAPPSTLIPLIAPTIVPSTEPGTTALLRFHHPLIAAHIREAKYHNHTKAFTELSLVLRTYLLDAGIDAFDRVVIIPLPLSSERLRSRGYNQCERIAAGALEGFSPERMTIDTTLLIRTRHTESQAKGTRLSRLTNQQGTFKTTRTLDPSLSYVLIDDVITTGATMRAAIEALTVGGATHIVPIALSSA